MMDEEPLSLAEIERLCRQSAWLSLQRRAQGRRSGLRWRLRRSRRWVARHATDLALTVAVVACAALVTWTLVTGP